MFEGIFQSISNWDFMSILYSLLGSILFFLLLKWFGLLKMVNNYFKNHKAKKTYLNSILDDCNTLIVVGKRKGFSLNDVYVELDLAPSDLMSTQEKRKNPESAYVLIGGPGAGKSTTAKRNVIRHVENKDINTLPFFIRLKDYNGDEEIEEFLVHKLDNIGFIDPKKVVKLNLNDFNSLCVLDGLDEVRPHLKKKVCDQINSFYSKYFMSVGKLIVTCRKEAYRDIPLNIPSIWEVRPLSDEQIKRFANKWPLPYPTGKSKDTFFNDLVTSPRILELARSPLLLVGGLMHYTEANLGIPEERFEYLQTMSKWLITDWAVAQGHAPDPYKNVYDRILSKLAFYMHHNSLSEIPTVKANEFVGEQLPTFGYMKEEGEKIVTSISIKTGILIKDGSSLFFAQFGLQEYFSSIELLNQIKISEISRLSPSDWWRETILLTVAQQREPSKIISHLFANDPLLGVAAVAECPTPSIDNQNEAISICLTNIDNKNEAVKGALIPLLRKTRGEIEIVLCSELEKRLNMNIEISSLVGISLATAGTPSATNTLAKHPEVWNACLSQTGYLSSNFENLLINWIQDGDDFQSIKAANLLSSRLSKDRLLQLLQIIPQLSNKKKDHLSQLILRDIAMHDRIEPDEQYADSLSIISMLSPNINNYKSFLKDILPTQRKELSQIAYQRNNCLLSIVISFFFKNKEGRCNSKEIHTYFSNSILWNLNKKSFSLWTLAPLTVLLIYINHIVFQLLFYSLFISIFFILINSSTRWRPYFPEPHYYIWSRRRLSHHFLFLLGGLTVLFVGDVFKLNNFRSGYDYAVLGSSIVFSIVGFLNWSDSRNRYHFTPLFKHKINLRIRYYIPNYIFILWVAFILNCKILAMDLNLLLPYNVIISFSYFLWVVFNILYLNSYWNKVKEADNLMQKEIDTDLFNHHRYFY